MTTRGAEAVCVPLLGNVCSGCEDPEDFQRTYIINQTYIYIVYIYTCFISVQYSLWSQIYSPTNTSNHIKHTNTSSHTRGTSTSSHTQTETHAKAKGEI